MSFTAQLGTSSSQLGNIEPGLGAVETPTSRFGPGSSDTSTPGISFTSSTLAGNGYFRADPFIQSRAAGLAGSLAFTSNVTAGSTLVMAFSRVDNTSRVTNVTDTLGNTWVNTGANFVAQGQYVCQWATYNIASGGANTVTLTGTTGQLSIWELGLGTLARKVNSATGSEASGTSHTTGSVTTTGVIGVMVESSQFTGVGSGSVGTDFNHSQSGSGFFHQMGACAPLGSSSTGPWTSSLSCASAQEMVMYTDGVSGTGSVTFQKPTFNAGAQSGAIGTGSITISKPSFSGTGTYIGFVTGSGGVTLTAPSLQGNGKGGTQGSGGVEFNGPAFSGSGIWTNPTLLETQIAREDLEEADTQRINETQFAIEDIEEYDLPIINEAQFAVEDIEEYSSPRINLTQYCVEILIPFDCDLTPPLTLPPGCPPDEIEGTGSDGPGCEANDAQGTGSDDDGCTPTVRTS